MSADEVKRNFVGKWKLDRSENFDGFLREVGVNFVLRKIASSAKPVQEISVDDEDKIHIVIKAGFRDVVDMFKLDEEFEKITDGNKLKVKITVEDGKLRLHEEPVDPHCKIKSQTIIREIVGDEMLMTMYVGDIICKRWFKRQES